MTTAGEGKCAQSDSRKPAESKGTPQPPPSSSGASQWLQVSPPNSADVGRSPPFFGTFSPTTSPFASEERVTASGQRIPPRVASREAFTEKWDFRLPGELPLLSSSPHSLRAMELSLPVLDSVASGRGIGADSGTASRLTPVPPPRHHPLDLPVPTTDSAAQKAPPVPEKSAPPRLEVSPSSSSFKSLFSFRKTAALPDRSDSLIDSAASTGLSPYQLSASSSLCSPLPVPPSPTVLSSSPTAPVTSTSPIDASRPPIPPPKLETSLKRQAAIKEPSRSRSPFRSTHPENERLSTKRKPKLAITTNISQIHAQKGLPSTGASPPAHARTSPVHPTSNEAKSSSPVSHRRKKSGTEVTLSPMTPALKKESFFDRDSIMDLEHVRKRCIRVSGLGDQSHIIDVNDLNDAPSIREKVFLKFNIRDPVEQAKLAIFGLGVSGEVDETCLDDETLLAICKSPNSHLKARLVLKRPDQDFYAESGSAIDTQGALADTAVKPPQPLTRTKTKASERFLQFFSGGSRTDDGHAETKALSAASSRRSSAAKTSPIGPPPPLGPPDVDGFVEEVIKGSSEVLTTGATPMAARSKTNKLEHFFGERPPSDLIADNLEQFFPSLDRSKTRTSANEDLKANSLKHFVKETIKRKRQTRSENRGTLGRRSTRAIDIPSAIEESDPHLTHAETEEIANDVHKEWQDRIATIDEDVSVVTGKEADWVPIAENTEPISEAFEVIMEGGSDGEIDEMDRPMASRRRSTKRLARLDFAGSISRRSMPHVDRVWTATRSNEKLNATARRASFMSVRMRRGSYHKLSRSRRGLFRFESMHADEHLNRAVPGLLFSSVDSVESSGLSKSRAFKSEEGLHGSNRNAIHEAMNPSLASAWESQLRRESMSRYLESPGPDEYTVRSLPRTWRRSREDGFKSGTIAEEAEEMPESPSDGDQRSAIIAANARNVTQSTIVVNEHVFTSKDSVLLDDSPATTLLRTFTHEPDVRREVNWARGPLIGQGSFGKVYYGVNIDTGDIMAVKQVELTDGIPRARKEADQSDARRRMIDALHREITLLKDLDHENIVRYLGYDVDGNVMNVFLEYVSGGSIASSMATMGRFEEPLVRSLTYQILCGLEYLHERCIIHRDIKGGNILLDDNGIAKISDFGISKKNEYKMAYRFNSRMSLKGTVHWMAPEVIKAKGYSAKVDIWSLGCLVLEMFTGYHPWQQLDEMQTMWKLGRENTPPMPDWLSESAKDFLDKCFTIDPDQRPTATELLTHPFADIDPDTFLDFRAYKEAAIEQKRLEEEEDELLYGDDLTDVGWLASRSSLYISRVQSARRLTVRSRRSQDSNRTVDTQQASETAGEKRISLTGNSLFSSASELDEPGDRITSAKLISLMR